MITEYFDVGTCLLNTVTSISMTDDYDYSYDTDSSDQTDKPTLITKTAIMEQPTIVVTVRILMATGNSGDDGADNTGGSDDNGDRSDSSYHDEDTIVNAEE